jgi:aminoglycoside phosphotransferase (APT) family kinase protein
MLMDFDPGKRLFGKPTAGAIFRSMFDRRHHIARFLAEVTVAIQRVDASPIATELAEPRTVGPGLNWFYSRASALGEPALIERAERLFVTRPRFERSVLCHGDVHPLNILRSPGRDTVVDWTHAQYDDPLYDVAFTWLGLTLMPLPVPGFLRRPVAAYGRRLGAQFLAAYERASGTTVDRDRLDWFTNLVALRIYVEAEEARRKGLSAEGFESAGLLWEPYLRLSGR